MKINTPADFLQKIQRNTKAFTAAETSGDLKTAQRLAKDCAALYNQLARRVPLRELYYREQAKSWKKKAEEIAVTIPSGSQKTGTDMIDDEVATSSIPKTEVRSATAQPRHQVFISYSKPDRAISQDLCSYLEAQNIPCWIAPRDVIPGSNFPGSIIDAIDESKVVVLIFSKSSDNSPHVIRELTRAVTRNLLILPFRIEEILPTKNMDYLINISHWFDAFPPPEQQYFGTLTQTIKTHLNGVQTIEPGPAIQGGK
jgi:hypothetical protein